MERKFIVAGSVFGALSVVLGALASHALKAELSSESLTAFQTGVKYQMYHALLMLIIPFITQWISKDRLNWIFNLLLTGIICFSWSIFLLTTGPLLRLSLKFLGPITPIGGLCLISAWILILFQAIKKN